MWREAHFQLNVQNTSASEPFLEVAMSKKCTLLWCEHLSFGALFRSCDVEKVHAVVVRTHLQVKSKKHLSFGALLEVAMSKKCMLLWCEAHVQVKKLKTLHIRTTFGS